ncbi:hypothetical protein EG68_01946 [Paragonimus skrjabini miyazakii]|uniref:Uncharacterized protein n=1 Tax=Paragonimus skrjabini miyazakii TaxID=59628 RepID=A0A8S9Z6B9_9TREM|nr:hypothetical protein EG68_01946 [Paragonimus skrjabini miyazakii]
MMNHKVCSACQHSVFLWSVIGTPTSEERCPLVSPHFLKDGLSVNSIICNFVFADLENARRQILSLLFDSWPDYHYSQTMHQHTPR